MSYNFGIEDDERNYLRELAKRVLEYANLPVMEERKKLWYGHNSLKGEKPVLVMEYNTFENDILPEPQCRSGAAREIERNLMRTIVNHELIDDDKVVSPYYTVFWNISLLPFGEELKRTHAKDSSGRAIGYQQVHLISDLKEDFPKLRPSVYSVNREYTAAWKEAVENILGDILPVKIKNDSLRWYVAPSQRAVELMGLEAMMFSMVDYPDDMHRLYDFIKEDTLAYVKWQEEEGLLTLNNENDYAGAGSYGFSRELPTQECIETGHVGPRDLWLNMNSQETVGISPSMFGEFIFPYYYELAKLFGLVYYGCCEPVHPIWEKYISQLPGLRKVSVSPWCDEEFMGRELQPGNVIYSRKPSPNYIGVGSFDEEAFAGHIGRTLKAARGCKLEIIFRDVYTLCGEPERPGRAIKIARELIDRLW